MNAATIKVFRRDLSYAFTIGSRGQGPGEFHNSIAAFSVCNGRVWAFETEKKALYFEGGEFRFEMPLRGCQLGLYHLSTAAFACDDAMVLIHTHPKSRKLAAAYSHDGKFIQGVGDIFPIDRETLLQNPATNDTMWVKGGDYWFAVFEYHPLVQKFDSHLNLVTEYAFEVPATKDWLDRWGEFIPMESFKFPPEMNTDLGFFEGHLWLICYGALVKINAETGQFAGVWHFFGRGSGFEATQNGRLNLYTFDFFQDGQIVLGSISDTWGGILWTADLNP